ncbi:MAG: LacI family transcriptional regulator [Chloroflexi bacterium]|nr:LacI family transcriptional regulator [Chloroflexota bacterium]MCA2000964.1 LacI family transcriptional regulator [Chloroflexota bacterium]
MISDKKKRVTIKDVAQAAGVSTQTVSRVMNKFSYVSEDTRKRVEEVVERLGYNPSALARSLIQRRSYTLGVVTSGLKHIGPSRTLNGVADKADELGYMLLMKELDNFDNSRVGEAIDSLLARQVDGIVWAAPEIGDNHSWLDERLDRIPVPVIFLSMRPRKGVFSVATDNYQGGAMAIRHLLGCGRKKIGHISGPLAWWEAVERKRAWRETLIEAGLDAREEHCAEGNWSAASGEQAFIRLLESYPDMDAVFVANDQMALSVLREAARRGVSVPSQLAVVGFDNIPESAYFHPSLTTVFQDLQLLGEQAAQIVVEMIQARQQEQPTFAQSKFIQPALIIRESSQ